MSSSWYNIDVSDIDTPALLVDIDKVKSNIQKAIAYAGGLERLRPHVKTHKTLEIAQLQVAAGIIKYKCATIPEAEMLGMAGAADVLIAYQPQGPKIKRALALREKYPSTTYHVLVDNAKTAHEMSDAAPSGKPLSVYIDVNDGHNRSGIKPEDVPALVTTLAALDGIQLTGLHCYDGHIRMADLEERTSQVVTDFSKVIALRDLLTERIGRVLPMVAGGTPSFYTHAQRHDVECSPGTWIFWDQRYGDDYRELEFAKAAVVLTRVISQIDSHTYCLDMGHKSIASESPYPRVSYVNQPGLEQIGHSEEHMVVKSAVADQLEVGQLVIAYPYHVCPTVALYDTMHIAADGKVIDQYKVIARDRKINI